MSLKEVKRALDAAVTRSEDTIRAKEMRKQAYQLMSEKLEELQEFCRQKGKELAHKLPEIRRQMPSKMQHLTIGQVYDAGGRLSVDSTGSISLSVPSSLYRDNLHKSVVSKETEALVRSATKGVRTRSSRLPQKRIERLPEQKVASTVSTQPEANAPAGITRTPIYKRLLPKAARPAAPDEPVLVIHVSKDGTPLLIQDKK